MVLASGVEVATNSSPPVHRARSARSPTSAWLPSSARAGRQSSAPPRRGRQASRCSTRSATPRQLPACSRYRSRRSAPPAPAASSPGCPSSRRGCDRVVDRGHAPGAEARKGTSQPIELGRERLHHVQAGVEREDCGFVLAVAESRQEEVTGLAGAGEPLVDVHAAADVEQQREARPARCPVRRP